MVPLSILRRVLILPTACTRDINTDVRLPRPWALCLHVREPLLQQVDTLNTLQQNTQQLVGTPALQSNLANQPFSPAMLSDLLTAFLFAQYAPFQTATEDPANIYVVALGTEAQLVKSCRDQWRSCTLQR